MAAETKGTIRIAYEVDDSQLQTLPAAQDKIEAVGAAAASTAPDVQALAAAMRASKLAAKEEAAALGLTVTEYRRVQTEAAKAAKVAQREAQATAAVQVRAAQQVAAATAISSEAQQKAAGAVSRGLVGLGQQASDVASQLTTGTNPLTILVQQGPQIAGVLGEMGIGMAVVAKGAGVLVAGLAGLTVTGVALYGALGQVADVVGTLAGRLTGLELEPTTEAIKNQREAAAILAKSYEDMGPILEDTREKQRLMRVELGLITEEQAKVEKSAEDAFARYNTAVEGTRLKLVELRKEQASLGTKLVDSAESWMPAWTPLGYAVRNLTDSSADLQVEIDAGNQAMGEQASALAENAHLGKRLIAVTEGNKKEEEKRKRAVDGSKDALRALNDELARQAKLAAEAEKAYQEAIAGFNKGEEAGRQRQLALSESAAGQAMRENAEYKKEKALLFRQEYQLLSGNLSAQETLREAFNRDIIANDRATSGEVQAILAEQEKARTEAIYAGLDLRQKTSDAQRALDQQGLQDSLDIERQRRQAAQDTLNAILSAAQQVSQAFEAAFGRQLAAAQTALDATRSDLDTIRGLIDGLSIETVDAARLSGAALVDAYKAGKVAAEDLSETQRESLAAQLAAEEAAAAKREKAQQDAALAAWEAQHAAAMATALINIPLAISQALAGAPYPINLALAAISGGLATAAAVQVANESPPSFRSGKMPDYQPRGDQRLAYIEPSEVVAPASAVQAMGGQDATRRTFAGVAPAGGAQITQFKLGHRLFNEMVRDASGRPGAFRDMSVRPRGLRRND